MKGLSAPEKAARRSPKRPAPKRVLVVESDDEVREDVRLELKAAGYDVTTAEDAVTAGHRVLERAPDAIVIATDLPYLGGAEFVAALRAERALPEIAVVFMASEKGAAALASRTDGSALLVKPIATDQLLETVAREIELRAVLPKRQ